VDAAAVPQHSHGPAQTRAQMLQVRDGVLGMGILILGQQVEVQIQTAADRADGDTADRRDTIASIPSVHDGSLAARRPSAADAGRQHEA